MRLLEYHSFHHIRSSIALLIGLLACKSGAKHSGPAALATPAVTASISAEPGSLSAMGDAATELQNDAGAALAAMVVQSLPVKPNVAIQYEVPRADFESEPGGPRDIVGAHAEGLPAISEDGTMLVTMNTDDRPASCRSAWLLFFRVPEKHNPDVAVASTRKMQVSDCESCGPDSEMTAEGAKVLPNKRQMNAWLKAANAELSKYKFRSLDSGAHLAEEGREAAHDPNLPDPALLSSIRVHIARNTEDQIESIRITDKDQELLRSRLGAAKIALDPSRPGPFRLTYADVGLDQRARVLLSSGGYMSGNSWFKATQTNWVIRY